MNLRAVLERPWFSSVSRTMVSHVSYSLFALPGVTSYGRTRYRHFISRSPMISALTARCSSAGVAVKPGLSSMPCVEMAITGICG